MRARKQISCSRTKPTSTRYRRPCFARTEFFRSTAEFLPAQREGKVEWTPFATIKTSGYEQWLGAQVANRCQPVIWDSEGDLSSSLQTRLDSMR